jgi:hypothetical protein
MLVMIFFSGMYTDKMLVKALTYVWMVFIVMLFLMWEFSNFQSLFSDSLFQATHINVAAIQIFVFLRAIEVIGPQLIQTHLSVVIAH